MTELNRRHILKLASVAAVGAAAATGPITLAPAAAAAPLPAGLVPKWPGHRPGQVYLGFSSQDSLATTVARTGPVGLYRTYYNWSGGAQEDRVIAADHAAGRLPWISFKPSSTAPGGWAAIASGRYDADIRARAHRYATFSKPVVVTFNHEPDNDKTGTGAEFARAWTHIHDVMQNETKLKNVVSVPIVSEWVFNPANRQTDPPDWITPGVLDRCAFLGIDLYQNASGKDFAERVGRIIGWLDAQGHSDKMVGIGETGTTDGYTYARPGVWWTEQWAWVLANTDRVGAVSYFSSLRSNNSGNNWLLWESTAKLTAYKASLAAAKTYRGA